MHEASGSPWETPPLPPISSITEASVTPEPELQPPPEPAASSLPNIPSVPVTVVGGEKPEHGGSHGEHDEEKPLSPTNQKVIIALSFVYIILAPVLLLLVILPSPKKIPLSLALATMLLVGYLFGRAMDWITGLPPLLGYMAFGFIYKTEQEQGYSLKAARPYLINIAFIIVLVRASLHISPKHLNRFTLSLATFPFAVDVIVCSCTAAWLHGLTSVEAATFGSIMSCLGEGIIIPRMIDMMQRVAGSGREALPEAVLIAAPIEAILSLFMYGACAGILGAQRAGQATGGAAAESEVAYDLQIGLLVVKIIVTLLVALALAHVFAIFLGARTILKWPLKPTADQGASQSAKPRAFFTGSAPEEVLLVLSMAIIAYALNYVIRVPASFTGGKHGEDEHGESLINADLSVCACVFAFAQMVPHATVHRIETSFGQLWVFGALFLFVSLGANLIVPTSAEHAAYFLPTLFGLIARQFANLFVLYFTAGFRGVESTARNLAYETIFLLGATMPRATIQGVLNALPLENKLVSEEVGMLYKRAAAICVLILAPAGIIIQTLLCEKALGQTAVPVIKTSRHAGGEERAWSMEKLTGTLVGKRLAERGHYMRAANISRNGSTNNLPASAMHGGRVSPDGVQTRDRSISGLITAASPV